MNKELYEQTKKTLTKLVSNNDFLTNYRLSENIIIDNKMQERLEPLDFYLLVRLLDEKGVSFNKRKTKDKKPLDSFMLGILSSNLGILLGLIECNDTITKPINKNNMIKLIEDRIEEPIKIDKLSDYSLEEEDRLIYMILNLNELCLQMVNKPSIEEIVNYFIAIENKNKNQLTNENIKDIYNFLNYFEYLEIFKEEYKQYKGDINGKDTI